MFFILFITLLLLSLNIPICDGDTFFHLAVGDYILKNGFPVKDPFSIHNITYMPHEWLSDVIFSTIYKVSGYIGLFTFQYIIIFVLFILMYKLNMLVSSKNKYLSILLSVITVFYISRHYITIRPQIFTYIIIIFEIYIIEYYLRTKKGKVLFLMPILALLLTNFHIGVYPLFFILILPYLFDCGVPVKIGRLKSRRAAYGMDGSFTALITTMLGCIPIGIVNPYGIKKVTYFSLIFSSEVTTRISEWMSPDFDTGFGMGIFICFLIVLAIFMLNKNDISIRTVLMLSGTGYMVLSGVRYLPYFLICTCYILTEYVSGLISAEEWKHANILIMKLLKNKISIALLSMLVIFTALAKTESGQWKVKDLSAFPDKAVEYLKNNTDYRNLRLYNEYYHGGFLMFNGIKVFIDPRGDLYVNQYNPGCNVLNEYRKVAYGTVYYKDIFDKYLFDYALVNNGQLVDIMLCNDVDWKKVYVDDRFTLYMKAGGQIE